MKKTLLLLYFIPVVCNSQVAKFSELRLKTLPEKYNTDSATIIYPFVRLDDKNLSEKINSIIRKTLLFDEDDNDPLISIDSALQARVNDGLINLTYEAVINKKEILSLRFYLEGVAAYPTSWQEYLNFDLKTGEPITLKNVIKKEKYNEFALLVKSRK